jgi:aspartate-semialdehyde dehydrogenase
MRNLKVAVLGATGAVGQKFVRLLENHPWFRLTEVVVSDRHAGRTFGEAIQWIDESPMPAIARELLSKTSTDELDADVCFSALPGGKAGVVERKLAERGYRVFTNARDLRMKADVPLVVAEVNPDHLALVEVQRRKGQRDGFVVANGNCTAIILSLALKPLSDQFGVEHCHVVSMQALSGAGYPGVPSLEIEDNLVPFISEEEPKVETEVPKVLGALRVDRVIPDPIRVSATCTRVPVLEGHTLAVSVRLRRKPSPEEIREAFLSFRGEPQRLGLPSAPEHPVIFREEEDRPQPRRDREAGGGMSLSVGRIRPDPLLGWKFVVVGSNMIRGAAGASILNAELAAAAGLL